MLIEALFNLTRTPLKIWRRRSSCRTLRTFGLTPLILEIDLHVISIVDNISYEAFWLIIFVVSEIIGLFYICITIVDKSGKECTSLTTHLHTKISRTFTWIAINSSPMWIALTWWRLEPMVLHWWHNLLLLRCFNCFYYSNGLSSTRATLASFCMSLLCYVYLCSNTGQAS